MNNEAHIDGNGNIVIQGVEGTIITVNPNNAEEIRQLIIDFGSKLSELPKEIIEILEKRQDVTAEIKAGANLYLSVLAELHELKEFRKLKFGLTITNLTKENRYFNQPFFKVYPKFTLKEGFDHDTFIMVPEPNTFPQKLEYGEPFSVIYQIKPAAYDMYKQILDKDKDAHIQAFTNTTVGELYESNKLLINDIFKQLAWLNQ
jgi:hypothetical protein